jgi:8-oxo-dGTP diphosphatase
VREPSFAPDRLQRFLEEVITCARPWAARVLVNADVRVALRCGADGVHLKASQLRTLDERPHLPLVAASCHDRPELELALARGVDFVVLGPVAPTLSHPGAAAMGFEWMAQLIRGYPLPVYALGGMRAADKEAAWTCGAHGIAMQRGAWV